MGVDFVLRTAFKISMFVVYMSLVQTFISLVYSYLKDFSMLNSLAFSLASYLGIFEALAVFLNIIIISFVSKHALSYWKSL